MAITAVVKGCPSVAVAAAHARGINTHVLEYAGGMTTLLVTTSDAWLNLARWLAESEEVVPGFGYPLGTLLLFTDRANFDRIAEAQAQERAARQGD